MIAFDIDLSPVAEYIDIHEELVRQMSSRSNITNTVDAMARSAKAGFLSFADRAAIANRKNLHHVYEWGQVGDPYGRLFRMILSGRGGEKMLNYDFKASQKTVPVGSHNSGVPNDTRKQVHIFVWKAPIMEERSTPITIVPSIDKGILAYPMNGVMAFSSGPVRHKPDAFTHGKFSELWLEFWGGLGREIVVEDIVNPTDKAFIDNFPGLYSNISVSRPRPKARITIGTKKKKSHKREVKKFLDGIQSGYLRAARQREAFAGGGDSDI